MSPRPGEPDVTVCIVSHSNRPILEACLRTLLRGATSRHEVVVAILDNASTDGSAVMVRDRYPEVRLIAQGWRDGFGANQNRLIAASCSRYVMLLNDDASLEPATLDELVDRMDERPETGALAPRIISPGGAIQHTAWLLPTPLNSLRFALTLGWANNHCRGGRPRRVQAASGCALLLRRSAVEEVGGFDEGFFMYVEDSDLCRRLASGGHGVLYWPAACVVHHGQQSSSGVPARRVNENWRSLHRYWSKHHGPVGHRVAAWSQGAALWGRGVIAAVVRCVPAKVRPRRTERWVSGEYWLAARNAWFGVRGPGLRELADEWNRTTTTEVETHPATNVGP
jgi:GT2 family glycosyltransferase